MILYLKNRLKSIALLGSVALLSYLIVLCASSSTGAAPNVTPGAEAAKVQELSAAMPFLLDSDEFPMGMFSVDSTQAMDQVMKMGLTYVHTYAMGGGNDPEDIARDLAYMDQAHERGLKVIFNLGGDRWAAMENGMLLLVSAVKDHPALVNFSVPSFSGKVFVQSRKEVGWVINLG